MTTYIYWVLFMILFSCGSNSINSKVEDKINFLDKGMLERIEILKKVIDIDTIKGKAQDTLSVSLPAHMNTGYAWSIHNQDSSLVLVKKRQSRSKEDLQHYYFKAKKEGVHAVTFIYDRSFDPDTAILKNRETIFFQFKDK
jgi:predicted secreted protein